MRIDTFVHALGRPVVANDSAESIGTVKGFVVAADARRIDAVHVDGHGSRAVVLGRDSVTAFGADAVMAASSEDPARVESEREVQAVTGKISLLGSRVLRVDGVALGTVDDVEFDADTGHITRVLTDHGPLDAGSLRAVGSYALIVDGGQR